MGETKISVETALGLVTRFKGSERMIQDLKAASKNPCSIKYLKNARLKELSVGADVILCEGNLKVDDIVSDCQGVDSSLLIVLGNLECKSLLSLSDIHVFGDVLATNVIATDSLCDCGLYVGGNLKTPTILEYGHTVQALGAIDCADIYSFHQVKDKNGRRDTTLEPCDMVTEILKSPTSDQPSLSKTIRYIRGGGSVFRSN